MIVWFIHHRQQYHLKVKLAYIAWKVSKYGVISGPYFPAFGVNTERYEVSKYLSVFSPNVGKYGPEITPYGETFHAVLGLVIVIIVFGSDRTSSAATLLNYLHIMYQSIFCSFSSDFFTYQINFSVLWPVWALRSLESCVSYLPSCFCFYTFFWMLWMVITVNKFSL